MVDEALLVGQGHDMLSAVTAKVGIVADSALEHFVMVGLVRAYYNRMLHLDLLRRVRNVCSLSEVAVGLRQVGAVAAEARYPQEVLEAEMHKVTRLQKFASFHFSGVVVGVPVVDTGSGYHFSDLAWHILGLRE
jgi:hypothetical protein